MTALTLQEVEKLQDLAEEVDRLYTEGTVLAINPHGRIHLDEEVFVDTFGTDISDGVLTSPRNDTLYPYEISITFGSGAVFFCIMDEVSYQKFFLE